MLFKYLHLECKNKKTTPTQLSVGVFNMAGAEGLEPSARGFGVDVGRKQGKKKWRSRGVCQGEEGSCGAELVLKAGAGKNIARTLREEKSDIGKPIVRAWGKHRGPNRRRFCRQREKSLRVALCAVFGAG